MRTRLCLSLFVLLGCGDPERGAPPGGARDGGTRDAGADRDAGDGGSDATATCARMACDAMAVCTDEGGTARCSCLDGYEGDGLTCTDIDECEDGGGCDENAVCINLPGGHRCLCDETFSGDGTTCTDQDECADPLLNTCDPNATCSDTDSGFGCACNEHFAGDGFGCGDVDECDADLFECPANSTCENTFGGHRCPCDPGFADDGADGCVGLCELSPCAGDRLCRVAERAASCTATACRPGFVGDGATCVAIDTGDSCAQCDGQGSDEVAGAVCAGTPGSGTCACGPGYNGTFPACTDVQECGSNNGGCGDPALYRCTELPGGYFCDCAAGYEWDGTGCVDRNECTETPRPCHPDAQCTNTAGSYSCACRPGYAGDGAVCRDVDECQEEDDDCLGDGTARCVNTPGSHECRCRRGYAGDGVTSCTNLDECSERTLNECADNAICTDVSPADNPLGYQCSCPEGFAGSGTECTDLNECLNSALNECDEHATCVNHEADDADPSGYHCECQDPYTGDDPQQCYCDLSGWWAMRHDFDVCWCDRKASDVTIISGGEFESTAWELHKYSYDGDTLVTEKKSCGAQADPDVISPFFGETYGSYIPQEVFFDLPLRRGRDVPESGIVPGRNFTTPDEAFVDGIDIGPDPLCSNCWPATYGDVNPSSGAPPRWVDTDGDGEVGITLWPQVPSDRTQASTSADPVYYSYLPADLAATSVTSRAGCVSVGTRVITRLHASVENCERIVGEIVNVKSEARIASCTRVPEADWEEDIACDEAGWSSMERCNDTELMLLDDQDQSLNTSATFELVKIGRPDDEVDCSDVIERLPAIVRRTPTPIDCNCP